MRSWQELNKFGCQAISLQMGYCPIQAIGIRLLIERAKQFYEQLSHIFYPNCKGRAFANYLPERAIAAISGMME